jgi:NAD(P)-dependent dehydrogenase (short-subunit alcohol dehydrogenase family)
VRRSPSPSTPNRLERLARTALVTGANRGIGFEAARQLRRAGLDVVLTGRDADAVPDAGERLRDEGLAVRVELLDVADARSVDDCAARLRHAGVEVDVLVNNAGALLDAGGGALQVDDELLRKTLEVNLFGPLRTARAFLPAMLARGYGRVVNVSSGAGQITEASSYAPAYSVSKAALNALTRQLALAARRGDVKVNAMCPGWVRTDMGGRSATRSPEEAVDTIIWLATLAADGPTNGFFRDRRPLAW